MPTMHTREKAPQIVSPARPAGPRPGGTTGISGRDFFKIIRKRKWLILICLLLFTATAVGGHFVWKAYLPIYEAQAYVLVTPPANTVLGNVVPMNPILFERHKMSNMRLVKGPSVLIAALEDETLKKTLWYKEWSRGDPLLINAQEELDEQIEVQDVPESDLIGISMSMWTGKDQEIEELPTIVNQIAFAFVKSANREATRQRTDKIRTLQEAKEILDADFVKLNTSIATEMRNVEAGALRKQVDVLTLEDQDLTRRLIELRIQQSDAAAAALALQTQADQGLLDNHPQVIQMLMTNPVLQRMEQRLKDMEIRRGDVEVKYGPDHPMRKTLSHHVDELAVRFEEYRSDLIDTTIRAMQVGQDQIVASFNSQVLEVDTRRMGIQAKRRDMNDKLIEIDRLEEQKEILQERIGRLQATLEDMRLVSEELPASVRQMATVPLKPTWPQLKVLLPLGIVMGLIFGVALAFLLEMVDTSIKTPTDITRRVDLPLLAMVPHGDDLEDEIEDFRLACLTAPHSLVSEAYRELRTNLLFSGPAQSRTLLVTSPSPDDGRTTVAVNLAVSIANSGRRVLLVDANFRRPSIQALFQVEEQAGLSDVLSGQCPWADCVRESSVPNLSVMVAGKLPPNPNELLGSGLATTVLGELAERYDQVIFDGPPILLITDACVLATQVDGVVLVVRAGANTYGIVQRSRQVLSKIGAHTLGVVLNGIRTTAGGYLQKNYAAFYDYTEEVA